MFVLLFIAACMSVTKLLSRQSAGTFSLHSRQPTLQQDMNDVCVVVHCCIFECCRIINAISRLSIISLLSFACFHVNPLYSRTWMFVLLFITAYMSVVESSLSQRSASTLSSIYILLCFHVNPFYSSAEWCLCCCSLLHIWVWWNHHSNQ